MVIFSLFQQIVVDANVTYLLFFYVRYAMRILKRCYIRTDEKYTYTWNLHVFLTTLQKQ